MDGFSPEQRFFLGWAQVSGSNQRMEAARLQTNTDPHPWCGSAATARSPTWKCLPRPSAARRATRWSASNPVKSGRPFTRAYRTRQEILVHFSMQCPLTVKLTLPWKLISPAARILAERQELHDR